MPVSATPAAARLCHSRSRELGEASDQPILRAAGTWHRYRTLVQVRRATAAPRTPSRTALVDLDNVLLEEPKLRTFGREAARVVWVEHHGALRAGH
jgi:hypothetical protein